MPKTLTNGDLLGKKRKEHPEEYGDRHAKRRSAVSKRKPSNENVSQLEEEMSNSPTDEAKLSEMMSLFVLNDAEGTGNARVAVTLCRVFIRSIFASPSRFKGQEGFGRLYVEYKQALLKLLENGPATFAPTWIELRMRLLKAEAEHLNANVWESGEFVDLLKVILEKEQPPTASDFLATKYVTGFFDCLFYVCKKLCDLLSESQSDLVLANCISTLSKLGDVPDELGAAFIEQVRPNKKHRITLMSLRKAVQSAWLAILRQPSLSIQNRKTLLRLVTPSISPWFTKPELLMDFLTDSYNLGGSQALLALSGLYQLISTKNLDFPSFYQKLYSLLDAQLLHSTHRSRVFRHLQIFLSSTHLPATLIASFIKRLARLALFAPPAAIVTIVPYTYNLLKDNPSTTFMMHRPRSLDAFEDPYEADETDPLLTNAIDSSLWELEALQSHYHPNVASIARIIGEQFTKQQYNIEDFLDHSYEGMMTTELGRFPKKAPVIEWKIPRAIFRTDSDATHESMRSENTTDPLLKVWNFD